MELTQITRGALNLVRGKETKEEEEEEEEDHSEDETGPFPLGLQIVGFKIPLNIIILSLLSLSNLHESDDGHVLPSDALSSIQLFFFVDSNQCFKQR